MFKDKAIVKEFDIRNSTELEEFLNNFMKDNIINNLIYTSLYETYLLATIFYTPKKQNKIDKAVLLEITDFIIENNKVSINLIQSNFSIGFNRTQEIIEKLEELGIVSEKIIKANQPREILVDKEEAFKRINES